LNQEKGFQLLDFEVSTKLVALDELEKRGITGLPKSLQVELVTMCKPLKDRADCHQMFRSNFVDVKSPVELLEYEVGASKFNAECSISATVKIDNKRKVIEGKGNGPIDAYLCALNAMYNGGLKLQSYEQHDIQHCSAAEAICYISISHGDGTPEFGAGINANTTHASLIALTAAANKALSKKGAHEPVEAVESLCSISATIQYKGQNKSILGSGTGPVAAFVSGVRTYYDETKDLTLMDYSQSARGVSKCGANSEAVCTIACSLGPDKKKRYGVGLDVNTNTASAKAVLSSLSLLLN